MYNAFLQYIIDSLTAQGIQVEFDDTMGVSSKYDEKNKTLTINRRKMTSMDPYDEITDRFGLDRVDFLLASRREMRSWGFIDGEIYTDVEKY